MFKTIIKVLPIFVIYSFAGIAEENTIDVDVNYMSGTCSENFAMFKVEFTNHTNKWITVSKQKLDFGGKKENSEVTIITGNKLAVWSEANDLANTRSRIKSDLITGALGIFSLSAIQSGNSNINTLGKIGAFFYSRNLTVDAISDIEDNYRGEIFPSGHLLKSNILVPPNLALIRWILVSTENNKDDQYITKLIFSYDVDDKSMSETYKIRQNENSKISSCDWQKSIKSTVDIYEGVNGGF